MSRFAVGCSGTRRNALQAFRREATASAIVEFAVIVPVLLLLLFGIISFATAFFQRNNLVAAVREGARFAAVHAAPCSNQAEIRDRVLFYFQGVGTAAPASPETDIVIDGCETPSPTRSVVRIENYPFVPLFGVLTVGTIPLSASASYHWERR
jgi:hypothetical protein